jgi:hypothetical protein
MNADELEALADEWSFEETEEASGSDEETYEDVLRYEESF